MKTWKEMYESIMEWEMEAGESFLDYFDSSFHIPSFMFWALGKEYIDSYKFDEWYKERRKQWSCISGDDIIFGEEPYSMIEDTGYSYEGRDTWQIKYTLAMQILAEFLVSTPVYQKRVEEFLINNPL